MPMTQHEFDATVTECQNIQKQHNWKSARWQAASDRLRAAVLIFKNVDIRDEEIDAVN